VDSPQAGQGLELLLDQLLRAVGPARGTGGDTGTLAVSGSEARALVELLAARGIAQGELGTMLGLEKSTISRLAAGLERKGWIRRGRDEGNQRFIRIYLTPEGRAVAARVWQGLRSRQERILASLTEEERAGLATGLRGLVRGLAAEGLLADPVAAADPSRPGGPVPGAPMPPPLWEHQAVPDRAAPER
jgi:DNA-binding MarR family transcriptional regulator